MRKKELIVVLDVDTEKEVLGIVAACGMCSWFKVGAQLFTRLGPDIVRKIQGLGKNVFLDLKYHDIPNTVQAAVRAATALDAGLITLHASGGCAMIQAARKAVEGSRSRLLAVTVLTSLDAAALRHEIGLPETPEEAVARLARMAFEAGAHGLVCSPHEIVPVRAALGDAPILVTPGVRPSWASHDDQARVMTPEEAARNGADMVVVGRPILTHADPAWAAQNILEAMNP